MGTQKTETLPAITPQQEVMDMFEAMETEFTKALPSKMPAERFIRYLKTAIANDSKLLESDKQSLYNSALQAAQDGLYLDGKEATLTVFNTNVGTKDAPRWIKRVKYMPMVQGILKKVRNSGELSTLAAQVVHEKDKFRFWVDDTGEHIEHEPVAFGDRGNMIGAYALARTKDGANYAEIMSKDQVMSIKSKSKAQESLMWTTFESEGWRKSVIRRLSKRLPMSSDLEVVIQREDDLYDLNPEQEQPTKAATKSSRLNKVVIPKSATVVDAEVEPEPDEDQVPV